jgi:hypothetical protein
MTGLLSGNKELPSDVDSMRDAVFTVSPNKQYLGIVKPTTPATTGPKRINSKT